MTQPHMPDGYPPHWPRQDVHHGPGPALAGIAAIGATAVVLVLLAGLVALVLTVAWVGGHW